MKILITATIAETILLFQKPQIDLLIASGHSIRCVAAPATWFSADEKLIPYNFTSLAFSRSIHPIRDILCFAKLCGIIITYKPDIAWYSTPKASLLTAIASWFLRVPRRVYLMRGVAWCQNATITDKIMKLLDWISCFFSHKVIVVSESNKEYLLKNYASLHRKIVCSGKGSSHGVDTKTVFNPLLFNSKRETLRKSLNITDDAIVVGFSGRLVVDKGIPELIDAWKNIIAQFPQAKLLMIGPKHEPRDNIDASVLKYIHSESSILHVGIQSDMASYYAIMDILVHPSHREGFPNAILEAGAMKVPSITTDALGCKDAVLHNQTGIIFCCGDSSALADSLRILIKDAVLRKNMGTEARKWIEENFDSDIVNKRMIECLLHD